MKALFEEFALGSAKLPNRFVFPPIKLGYGNPDGTVTDRQLMFYQQISKQGPAVVILEPVSVTPEGMEHPKQLRVHLDESTNELAKIVNVIHDEERLACLHLNHAGAAANPKLIGGPPKAPSVMTCVAREGNVSEPMTDDEIQQVLTGYRIAAKKATSAGFDMIEMQGGHGYLVSQFLNKKLNNRDDRYGQDRLLFAKEVISAIKAEAAHLPLILRISGSEMSPEFGIRQEDLLQLLTLGIDAGINAIHVGMGHACFSPPWYFHHGSLPDTPQLEALSWIREKTSLPLIVAGRMGRKEKIAKVLDDGLADLVALGRPLISDPDLLEKWENNEEKKIRYCGYCLQGCLHRMKSGQPLGCNLNPEPGRPPLKRSANSIKALIAGGGPAGMSTALYMSQRGHDVILVEKAGELGGQFNLAWKAPGKESMKEGLQSYKLAVAEMGVTILLNKILDEALVKEIKPDLLIWATGALQNIPEITEFNNQYTMTSVEYFINEKEVKGPRILVIGAGRTGLEIAEQLGKNGYEVVATKRTDPIGSMMEIITRNLILMRIGQMPNIKLMPHTTVKSFKNHIVDVEQDGKTISLEPFQTIILASGMVSCSGPDEGIRKSVSNIETIGDAREVQDIYTAIQSGYEIAQKY